MTLRLDEDVAKVSVLVMVPLALQVGGEKANVWAALLLRWHLSSAGCQAG